MKITATIRFLPLALVAVCASAGRTAARCAGGGPCPGGRLPADGRRRGFPAAGRCAGGQRFQSLWRQLAGSRRRAPDGRRRRSQAGTRRAGLRRRGGRRRHAPAGRPRRPCRPDRQSEPAGRGRRQFQRLRSGSGARRADPPPGAASSELRAHQGPALPRAGKAVVSPGGPDEGKEPGNRGRRPGGHGISRQRASAGGRRGGFPILGAGGTIPRLLDRDRRPHAQDHPGRQRPAGRAQCRIRMASRPPRVGPGGVRHPGPGCQSGPADPVPGLPRRRGRGGDRASRPGGRRHPAGRRQALRGLAAGPLGAGDGRLRGCRGRRGRLGGSEAKPCARGVAVAPFPAHAAAVGRSGPAGRQAEVARPHCAGPRAVSARRLGLAGDAFRKGPATHRGTDAATLLRAAGGRPGHLGGPAARAGVQHPHLRPRPPGAARQDHLPRSARVHLRHECLVRCADAAVLLQAPEREVLAHLADRQRRPRAGAVDRRAVLRRQALFAARRGRRLRLHPPVRLYAVPARPGLEPAPHGGGREQHPLHQHEHAVGHEPADAAGRPGAVHALGVRRPRSDVPAEPVDAVSGRHGLSALFRQHDPRRGDFLAGPAVARVERQGRGHVRAAPRVAARALGPDRPELRSRRAEGQGLPVHHPGVPLDWRLEPRVVVPRPVPARRSPCCCSLRRRRAAAIPHLPVGHQRPATPALRGPGGGLLFPAGAACRRRCRRRSRRASAAGRRRPRPLSRIRREHSCWRMFIAAWSR